MQAEGAIRQDESRAYNVSGACGGPSNATSLSVNLTSVSPTVQTVLTLWDTGAARPGASTLNPDPLLTVSANTTNVALGTSCLFYTYDAAGELRGVDDGRGCSVNENGPSALPARPNHGDVCNFIITHDTTVHASVGGVGCYYTKSRGLVVIVENQARCGGRAP